MRVEVVASHREQIQIIASLVLLYRELQLQERKMKVWPEKILPFGKKPILKIFLFKVSKV